MQGMFAQHLSVVDCLNIGYFLFILKCFFILLYSERSLVNNLYCTALRIVSNSLFP